MKKSSRNRSTYSPVRQMGRNLHQDYPSIELQRGSRDNETAHNDGPQVASIANMAGLDEVYLCDCCGVTKQLSPGHQLLPTFKSLFFLFNVLVFVFGLANLSMGLWFRIDPKVYEIHKYIETQNFTIAGWIMLACGALATLTALMGFGAASRQVLGLLAIYFGLMIALTLANVGTLVLLTVYGLGAPLEQFITKEVYEQIRRKMVGSLSDGFMVSNAAQFLDFIQVKMRCCGAVNFSDYVKQGMVVPTTCYTVEKNFANAPGCGRAIRQLFDLRAGLAAGFSSASIICQLFTIILSALMFCSIYNWRAQPRPARAQLETQANLDADPLESHQHLYLQRPRSRTPIIM